MTSRKAESIKRIYSDPGYVDGEWNRVVADPPHRLEYDTTLRFLKKYLPRRGLILDAGGGPGRYTIALAKAGYEVVLLDLVPALLKRAREEIRRAKVEKRVREVVQGSITDLSRFKSNTFDAVLCLGGPLSHVCPESARRKAISELVRVAKRGAPIFASVMSRYGLISIIPWSFPGETLNRRRFLKLVLKGDDDHWRKEGFIHFFDSRELRKAFMRPRVKVIAMVGLEGMNLHAGAAHRLCSEYPKGWKNWVAMLGRICTDPHIVDASGHMMVIARKG